MNIYVGNLHFNVSEDELRKAFEEYGEVASVKIISDKYSGRSKGFGFVEMLNDNEAQNAIDSLNGAEIKGRAVNVNQAREKENNTGERRSFRPRS
ncbi:MAG: RNA-binding protein [Bacteroidales bacterium]|nr:RNA-binding protein [Bacteroidales bacterium]